MKKQNEPERQAKQKLREASRVQLVDPNEAFDDVLEFPETVDKDDFDYYVPEISGGASSEILVRLKGVHFFGLIFIAFLGDLRK